MKQAARIFLDKRSSPRFYDGVPFRLFILLGTGLRSPHELSEEVTTDISEGGLRFYDEWGMPDGALLEIQMQTPGSNELISQHARVRWKTAAADRPGFDVGVQFVDAAEEDRRAWVGYVRQRSGTSCAA